MHTPRHVNAFHAAFTDGHAKGDTIRKMFMPDFWHDYD